jgi:hypothetical protein
MRMFSFSEKQGIMELENEYIKNDQRCGNTFGLGAIALQGSSRNSLKK